MVPTKQRVFRENKLIKLLNEKFDKIHLIASMHSWSGFVDYPMLAGPVTKFTELFIFFFTTKSTYSQFDNVLAIFWRSRHTWTGPTTQSVPENFD